MRHNILSRDNDSGPLPFGRAEHKYTGHILIPDSIITRSSERHQTKQTRSNGCIIVCAQVVAASLRTFVWEL